MSARRWSKWWWQDWQRDPALRMCSLSARGAWMEMLCLMADAEPFGHLLVAGRVPNNRQLASVFGCSEKEAAKLLSEMEENGVFSRSEDGVIFSRRMVRDKAISDEASENGKKGGNPNITKGKKKEVNPSETKSREEGLTPQDNHDARGGDKHQEAEAEAEAEAEKKEEGAQAAPAPPAKPRGRRIPDDWEPDLELRAYATGRGFTVDETVRIAETFRDYWRAESGAKATKLDWDAAFRVWVQKERPTRGSAAPPSSKPQSNLSAQYDRLMANGSFRR